MKAAIDLRSDTVTQPTNEMREAMAQAVVGDDVYGEDPTINRLEELAAGMMGKEAGLFIASGTMGNLSAILAHCGRGDEAIMGDLSHTFLSEAGGVSALGGVHPRPLPNLHDGKIDLDQIRAAIREDNEHFPITRLICLENTHNRCGGHALSVKYVDQVAEIANERELSIHLDGARIFNAAAAIGVPALELAKSAHSVTFCLSKGLCAPVGSVLCGAKPFIAKARRIRKQLGGGMRQAGVIAAAGLVALENMVDRLPEDHQRARQLAAGLREFEGIRLRDDPPPSNMVFVNFDPGSPVDAAGVAQTLKKDGILIDVRSKDQIRLVLHYWIDDAAVEEFIRHFGRVLRDGKRVSPG
jgi:threonine aldolase